MGVVLVFASVLLSVVWGEQGAAKSVSRVLLALNAMREEVYDEQFALIVYDYAVK